MFEVGFAGVPGTGRKSALPITDLDQVAQGVIRLVGVRLVPVVAVGQRDGSEVDGELAAAGQGESPGAEAAWRSWVVFPGEGPGAVAVAGRRGLRLPGVPGFPGEFRAAVADRVPVGVGDRDAPLAVRALGGGGGEVAGEVGVEGAEAVSFAGPVGQAEQGGQREGQVGPGGQPGT
jgi:hypothetical protein